MHNTIWLLDARKVAASAVDAATMRLGLESRTVFGSLARDLVRRRFILSRALLRTAVSKHADCDPATIAITERRGNAPLVTLANDEHPFISMSHSGAWIACVVSPVPVGIDIEATDKPRDVHALSAWSFSVEEHVWFLRQPDSIEAFYRIWTGKEAIFKLASGLGWTGALLDIRFMVQDDMLIAPLPAHKVRFDQLLPSLACSLASRCETGMDGYVLEQTNLDDLIERT